MTATKKTGLWFIAALQFISVLYFVSEVVANQLGRGPVWMSEQPEYREVIRAIGLVLGVVLGWVALRLSMQRTRKVETSLRRYAIEFVDVLHGHFDDWHLTPAERDVALFLIKGLATKDIADLRGTSEGTIKAQTNAIYRKAGVAGRPQLLSLFIEDLMDDALAPSA